MARHIAGCARIVVDAPRAAKFGILLQDREIIDPGVLEPRAHAQSAETAADDHDPIIRPHFAVRIAWRRQIVPPMMQAGRAQDRAIASKAACTP